MKYLYRCNNCNKEVVIEKPMRECGNPERCERCERLMKRVYEPTSIKTGDGTKS